VCPRGRGRTSAPGPTNSCCYTSPVDSFRDLVEAFAVGALPPEEAARLEGHLRTGCESCRAELARSRGVLPQLSSPVKPEARVREQLIDISEAPALPIDPGAFRWEEPFPGFRMATVKEDPARSFRASLLWAKPGARFPAHRHGGDESVLVLQGAYRDEERSYGPGDIAHRRPGSVHSIEILPGEDCISYAVSYGEIEVVEP